MTLALAADAPQRAEAPPRDRAAAWGGPVTATLVGSLCLLAALAFARWQWAGAVVPWDAKNHFYPMFRFLGNALRHGIVPLWNPYHFAGAPIVADPQSLVTTPTMALLAFLFPRASMPAFDAMILGHLLGGALATLGLSRRLGWHPAAALLAAIVFMFGGSAAARLQHTGMIVSYAFVPAAIWSLQVALERRSLRHAVLAGLCAALLALGRDQVAFLFCLTLPAFALREICCADSPLLFARERAGVLLVALSITLAITAVPILLTMQFLHGSNRPGIAYGMALEGSLDPVNLLTLVAPNVFGSLDGTFDYWGPGAATVAGNDWTDRSIDYLFAGTVPVLLLVWHGCLGGRFRERGTRAFVFLAGVALLYACGRWTPVFGIAFDWLPGVSLYRRPADATFVANFGIAMASGGLLHAYVARGLPRPRSALDWLVAGTTVIGGAWLVGSGLSFASAAKHLAASLLDLTVAATVAAVAALSLALARPRQRGIMALALVVAMAAQLVWFNAASSLNAEPATIYSAYDGPAPDQARGLAILEAELAARHAKGEYPRVEIIGIDGSWQNAAIVRKLEDTAGYNPLRIADYEHAVGVAESAVDLRLRSFPATFRGYNSRLAALLGLDYLILDRSLADLPRQIPRPRATLLFAGTRFFVYRLDGAMVARATFVPTIVPVGPPRSYDATGLPAFDPSHEALIAQTDLRGITDPELFAPASSSGTAKITSYADNRVVVAVEAARTGVLVLHDLLYPGWQVRIDGVPTALLRADLLFRGVVVHPGHHSVEFTFQPFSLANLRAAAGYVLKGSSR